MGEFEYHSPAGETPKPELNKLLEKFKTDINQIEAKLKAAKNKDEIQNLEREWNASIQHLIFIEFRRILSDVPSGKLPEAAKMLQSVVEPQLKSFEKITLKHDWRREEDPSCRILLLYATRQLMIMVARCDTTIPEENRENRASEFEAEFKLKIQEVALEGALYQLQELHIQAKTTPTDIDKNRASKLLMDISNVEQKVLDLYLDRLELLDKQDKKDQMILVQKEMRFELRKIAKKTLPILRSAPVKLKEAIKYETNYERSIQLFEQLLVDE